MDVRVIAAKNRNLEKEVAKGRFRLDLYYHLNVFPVELPHYGKELKIFPHWLSTISLITIRNQKGNCGIISGSTSKHDVLLLARKYP
jgi:hypothetical protein